MCDEHLMRAMGYLQYSKEFLLTGHINDKSDDLIIEMFCDADFCGDSDHCYSTSGAWFQITGQGSQFPLAWTSRKQTAVSRSTTESETVALACGLFEEGIPLAELFSELLERKVLLRIREDSEACAKVVMSGYSRKLRHMRRTHKINLGSVKDQLDRDDTDLMLVRTDKQKGDIFTKNLEVGKWQAALDMLGMACKDYVIVHSSTAGLKMVEPAEATLTPDKGPVQAAPPTVRKKQKPKWKRAQRMLPYKMDDSEQ